ncbi:PAS domain S-box protein [Piscinibacter defluvii]|uniref:PAS domain S-box protein n=1 Tax=Piscinibacter defluvii TaxID=1796922 RepID=UPI000FDEA61D|nr:PAS domain S-box protein [Piscinibacter defluvii]
MLNEHDRLELREGQLRGMLETASEGIVAVDEAQTIVMANRAAADMFGRRVDQLIGADLSCLIPERFRARHRIDLAAFGDAEAPARRMRGRGEILGLRAGGEEFPLEAGISQAHVDGKRLYTVVLHDLSEERRAAAVLHHSAQMLAATFNVSNVGMVHIDPSTRRFVAVNAAFCALTGFDEAELLAMGPDDLNHPDDRLDEARFQALLEGRAGYRFEKRLVRKDGGIRHVQLEGNVVRDADGRVQRVVGVLHDVTARRAAEDALRSRDARQTFLVRLNDRLRRLDDPVAVTTDAVCLLGEFVGAQRVGYAEDAGDGVTIDVTQSYSNGVPDLIGRYRNEDYGPALLQALRAGRTVVRPDIAGDASLGDAEKAAHARLHLGASVDVPLLKGGRLAAVFFVHASTARHWSADEVALFEEVAERIRADIERTRAEAALRSAKAQLEAALASMNDAVFIADADGRVLTFNDAFVTFHRCRGRADCPTELQCWGEIVEVCWPDGSPASPEHWAVPRALRGETGSNVEYVLRRRDSGERWVGSYSFAPIRDAAGRIAGAVASARDVTEFKRMHAELQASHAELQRLLDAREGVQERERLRIARELHDDMQQSLAAVLMEATVVRESLGHADPGAAEALARIEHATEQAIASARRIIHDLRPQALEEFGLVAALENLAAQFSQRTGIACRVDASGLAAADEARLVPQGTCLYRVAQEALNNVAKHAHASTVQVTLASRAPQQLLLSVADDGIGIAAGSEHRHGAFGLIGMRERLRAAGGTLQVHSPPGGGTTLDAQVPLAPPEHRPGR